MSDIETFIKNIAADDTVAANNVFDELMKEKLSSALDQEKAAVATSVFGGDEEIEDDAEDYIEDEDQLELDQEDELEDEDI